MRESDDAAPLITLVPWEWGSHKGGAVFVRRELLWDTSPLDSAAEEDGLLSLPCMRFVAHRHCQYTLDKYFSGDYPGSRARIPPEASLLGIAVQALLPFVPGTIVEVMPVLEKNNSALRGAAVEKEYQSQQGDGEMDPDLIDAVGAIARAALTQEEERALTDENSFCDLVEDVTSMRWLQFYWVPKVNSPYRSPHHAPKHTAYAAHHTPAHRYIHYLVAQGKLPVRTTSAHLLHASLTHPPTPLKVKFVLNFFLYLAYMLYAAYTLVVYGAEGAVSRYEIFLWLWAISREIGEFFEMTEWSLAGLRMY